MKKFSYLIFALIISVYTFADGQTSVSSAPYWQITEPGKIRWDLNLEKRLPHQDNIEFAGKKVAAIIYYAVDENKNLTLEKDFIFPQLRTFNKSNEPEWKKYRAYFRRKMPNEIAPSITYDKKIINPVQLDSVTIAGMITFHFTPVAGLQIKKTLYPSMEDRLFVEEWQIKNIDSAAKKIELSDISYQSEERGYKGNYTFHVFSKTEKVRALAPNESYTFPVYYGATLNEEKTKDFDFQKAKKSRQDFLKVCQENLVLNTPDKVYNTLFYFSKIRSMESIYESSLGLIHSPGGGNYYVGIWANDQVEYSGPFFPYAGYSTAETAAYNTYYTFLQNIPKEDTHIPYAFEVDGNFPMKHLDRGDAAMIAYGTSLYLLNAANQQQAKTLWPLIEWCLEYCHKMKNKEGAIKSASDEMEGRIETGDANLSTSTLYYGGLKYSIPIARALGFTDKAKLYQKRFNAMEQVIEDYFGAEMEGMHTYRYFDGNKYLRHWICLPLTMDIAKRKEGTINALFNTLWTDNGVLVQYDPNESEEEKIFWDRATLYALRGALRVGATERSMAKLGQYSHKRLLGDHVPYAVEAYPENDMKHLSAESALYCRIFVEGLLGWEPLSFSAVQLTPKLPQGWDYYELNNFNWQGKSVDISVQRVKDKIELLVKTKEKTLYNGVIENGAVVKIQ